MIGPAVASLSANHALGCGTGLLCDAYAALGHKVTGVDPAHAMLAVARRKLHGHHIEWVQSSAQAFRSENRFDLIIMTGNAFQVLLDEDDIRATFATMARHLAEGGMIAFETRNPAIDWAARWDRDADLSVGDRTIHQSRRILQRTDERFAFETRFVFPDKTLISVSELRFLSRAEIEARLIRSRLQAVAVHGDWHACPFDEASSEVMIFIVKAAIPGPTAACPAGTEDRYA